MRSLRELIETNAQNGQVRWIGLRPARRGAMQSVESADIAVDGLVGDHAGKGKRAVTLIQHEHLATIAAFLTNDGSSLKTVEPDDLRRNIVVSSINLIGLKKRRVQIGSAVLLITGPCAPCSRMEETLGVGGYCAVRGHGGVTADIVQPGFVAVGDSVVPLNDNANVAPSMR